MSWKCYYGGNGHGFSLNTFSAIEYVASGPDRTRNLSEPATNVLTDLKTGHLPSVSWGSPLRPTPIIQGAAADPSGRTRSSSRRKRAAIGLTQRSLSSRMLWVKGSFMITHRRRNSARLDFGIRVPMIVMSPYAKPGYVSHTVYQFGRPEVHRGELAPWKLGLDR